MSRRLVRSLKNINSSQAEIKIKQATSNDSFGPTVTELNEIAVLTNTPKPLRQICQILTKRLNDTSQNWRHILKSLTVIQYCMIAGALEFVSWVRTNSYFISTLREFQIRGNDELTQQIRTKAVNITMLVKDQALLEEKRASFHIFRNQMSQPATKQRSSLDISRDSEELRRTDGILPVSIPMRGTHSLDISRCYGNFDFSNKILADISEE